MNFYFSNVAFNTLVAEYLGNKGDGCVLLSQVTSKGELNKWINFMKQNPDKPVKMFVDSGAFTAWGRNKQINIDEYINYLNENDDYLEAYASVDVIPGEYSSNEIPSEESVRVAVEKSWQNFLYMRSKVKSPHKLLYIYHIGEPQEALVRALNYSDEFGKIKYMGLGGMVGKSKDTIDTFLYESFKLIKDSPNPEVQIHTFGMTRWDILKKYPEIYSTDSTSFVKQAGFGSILVNGHTVNISSKTTKGHVFEKNTAVCESVKQYITDKGFDVDRLQEDYSYRALFNVQALLEIAEKQSKQQTVVIQQQSLF